ncbi:FAS1 domain-containing protein [Mariannaea sp. PMI_226]|nr:FAS1 domain-containing protein [Mariannaea sp. PMI_226]
MVTKKASLLRALRALIFLTSLPLLAHYLVSKWQNRSQNQPILPPEIDHESESNRTIWDILSNDESVSRFAQIVGELPDIVRGLSAPQARFTVYAPVNEAFESFYFPPDPPPFFGLFLAGYHMGPGWVPAEQLRSTGTVSSFVNGDIFFTYKQRISVQHNGDGMTLNHEAEYLPTDDAQSIAVNGHIHHIDRVLVLPNSTAHALRTRPQLSKLSQGLACTNLADSIYDTNAHVSQTLFAPTDAAFDRLGRKATKFLFSKGGRPYLRALLKYHVVANRTLFSDMYWPHDGAEMIDLAKTGTNDFEKFDLPTLHPNLTLSVESRKIKNRWQLSVSSCGSVENTTQHDTIQVSVPDIITMDGVVHLVDSLILPAGPPQQQVSWLSRIVSALWHQDQSVESLIDRLEPYTDDSEVFVHSCS